MALDLSRCRIPPEGVPPWPNAHFSHQPAGIEAIVKWDDKTTGRIIGGCFLLADDTGGGKTKQAIDASQVLFVQNEIDRVVVMTPGPVRSVWADQELGELAKHLWLDLPCVITEFHSRTKSWLWATEGRNDKRLEWYITNYEYLRNIDKLNELLPVVNRRTLLILDESAYVKNWNAEQTKAVRELRKRAGRVLLMNGTPIADKPFDVFAQANLMDSAILGITSMTKFKARYAVMGGYMATTPWGKMPTKVLRWQNLDDLQNRMAPYVIRRLKDDMGLPPKLAPVVLTTALTPKTWAAYKSMRDDMVVELSNLRISSSPLTITKIMRLAQLTSGFLGGIETLEEIDDDRDWEMGDEGERTGGMGERVTAGVSRPAVDAAERSDTFSLPDGVQEIGREKLDAFMAWLKLKLEEDENLKLLVMSRFRPEVNRVLAELGRVYPKMELGSIIGQQKESDRRHAKRLMDPRTTPKGPATVVMTSAGNVGLTLTASHTVFRMSRDTSLYKWLQGDDRVHRPTQVHPVSYFDLVAEGPKGQRTIDRDILAALISKFDVAEWTTSAWVTRLQEAA